ncbi:serine phosphatase RsbU (regulator of sigma subunit) [Actinomadura pelletieri DSM 43383]|uniref:Serine phosphatase RsbU (Regulator of sigma subunit) n=1 Tax=Actinomadura pelletieri DSM 43383 TaxID=1120940 RepID=A0A495QAJ7_9ACTN|nr:GAF domain-containing SpoIIE family protein phosphatase [Actinomadura pelletieri]RKS68702.1 serine phosphatase RsbU (regulator of sigma subunit) [Actinomadura pelletieri DSM 43383]
MSKAPGALTDVLQRLENIRAITDESFADMDVDKFLDTLLERVQQVLDVDTAVVLLLDRQARYLVAASARGIEEEVSQAVHVPVGEGFAGRIAADRRAVAITRITGEDVYSPLLIQRGLRSLLGVPLLASGTLVGVMHVGTVRERRFTAEEVEFLQLAAGQAALAVQFLLGRAERAGARELQRSLVPSVPSSVPGIEVSARYRPGKADVGGDWYDVFSLPSGETGVVMGDVVGHGLSAAVVMGRMRSVLRAYSLDSDDPAEVLGKLDRKFRHFEPEVTATALYAVCESTPDRVRLSSAGHLPPILALPGQSAQTVDMKSDVLIGLGEDVARHTAVIEFPPGAVLCFYTDGLVERRDSEIDSGISRLCDTVYAGPPEAVGAAVMSALVGRLSAEDDVALLVLRRSLS